MRLNVFSFRFDPQDFVFHLCDEAPETRPQMSRIFLGITMSKKVKLLFQGVERGHLPRLAFALMEQVDARFVCSSNASLFLSRHFRSKDVKRIVCFSNCALTPARATF